MEARVLGTDGGAYLRPLAIYKDMHGTMVDITPKQLPQVESHHEEIAHFLSVIKGEAEEIVKPEQVLDVQAILDAIYESGTTGREVRLD